MLYDDYDGTICVNIIALSIAALICPFILWCIINPKLTLLSILCWFLVYYASLLGFLWFFFVRKSCDKRDRSLKQSKT